VDFGTNVNGKDTGSRQRNPMATADPIMIYSPSVRTNTQKKITNLGRLASSDFGPTNVK